MFYYYHHQLKIAHIFNFEIKFLGKVVYFLKWLFYEGIDLFGKNDKKLR